MPINLSECKSTTTIDLLGKTPATKLYVVDMYVLVCSGNETRDGDDMTDIWTIAAVL